MALDSDAAGSRREARSREMPEDRATATANHRRIVPAEFDHDVVEMVVALQSFLRFARRAVDQAVVAAVGRVVAPGVARAYGAHRQKRARATDAVGPEQHAAQRQGGARRAAIALALQRADSRATQRAGKGRSPSEQKALPTVADGGEDAQRGQARGTTMAATRRPILTFSHGNSIGRDLRSRFSGLMVIRHFSCERSFMPALHHILLVDDDQTLREALAEQLALYDEFKLATAGTATAAVKAVQADRIDLAIMDVGLPDMDGREAVKLMRKNGFKSPVIMLTGQGSDADTVLGLEAGANDYVVKPFKFAVLLARIRAHLRQYEASEDAVFQVGPYTFHPGSKLLVSEKGSKTKLTEKETAILRFLYRAGRKPIAREVLLQEVWGYNSQVTTHTLETHIYRLRQKIEPDPGNARLLVTDAGGYRLNP